MLESKTNECRNGWHVAVWNMNGGPLPQELKNRIEKAVQDIVNETKNTYDEGVRLLMSTGE